MSERAEPSDPVFPEGTEDAEALQRVRAMVNAVEDGLYQLDADGRFVAVNDAVVELTGRQREELLGEHVSALLADDGEALGRSLTDPAGGSERCDVSLLTADGSRVHCEVRTSSLETGDGASETVGVVREVAGHDGARRSDRRPRAGRERATADASEGEQRPSPADGRRRSCDGPAESDGSPAPDRRPERDGSPERDGPPESERTPDSARALERERVVQALEVAREGIGLLDEDGVFVYVNEAYADTFGYEPGAMVGEHWDDLGIEADPDRIYDEVLPILEEEGQWTGRTTCVRSDGSTFRSQHSLARTESDQLVCIVRDVTEREARQQDLERYEAIVEAVEDGVYVVDEDGRFTTVNEAYAELLGYDREELLGEHVSLVVEDDVVERARQTEAALLDEEAERPVVEATLETADGGELTAEATFAMLPGDQYSRRVGVVRDITDRRERERRLERYERVLENLPVGVYRNTPGPDGEFVTANERLASIFDAESVEELLEYNVSDLYPDSDRRAEFSRTLERQGMVEAVELKQETLAGETIWISVTAIRTEEDGEVYFDGIVQDVTERKRTQQRLAEERDMFAQGPAIVFRWRNEPGWPVEYVSENVEDVLGYAPEELEAGDVPYTDLLLESELDRIAAEVEANSDDTTERFSHEPYRLRTADGDVRWVKDTTTVVRDDDGEVTHYLGYLVDITERKERERELAASNERLEQFAYAASHDLQEPLRMVSSYLQLIERRYGDRLDEDGREYLQFAVDGADRMRHMIEGLLEYSRVDSCGDPLEPVDLEDVLADVREDLRVRIEDSDAEIAVDSLPRVEGDEEQLRQLFQNLLDNAIEYSGDEPPRIRVEAERADDEQRDAGAVSSGDRDASDGATWAVSVSDDGVGIDAEDADRVFEIFQRLHSAEDGQGTGIGLALCRRIVERHGGEIWVDSEPGDGATFTFTLPAAGSDAA